MTIDLFPGGRSAPSVPPREPPARRPLAVPLGPTAPRPLGAPVPGPRRADDRRIAAASILVAAGFLVAAAAAVLAAATGAAVLAPWLPIHLALAGGASTAIAGVMPFFVAALAASPPASARLRGTSVGLVAFGAALVAIRGIAPWLGWAPVVGGAAYLAGIVALALAVRAAGRSGLMMRRPIVTLGYQLALVNVALGAALGTLAAAGWLPILERWALLRPAHAWLNLVGFVSLVIVTTGLHFVPTVLGARIQPRGESAIAVLATGVGPAMVSLGLVLGLTALAGAGALVALVGAVALAVATARIAGERGRWSSDPGWHLLASGGLVAGAAWYLVGIGLATWLVLARPADAWSTALVGGPLVVGWVIQVLVASWTHLLPAIGPGGPVEHARQRALLGRASAPRLVGLNLGVLLIAVGWPTGSAPVTAIGAALALVVVVGSVALAVAAARLARAG